MKQMLFNNQDRLMGIAAKALVLLGGALVALSLALAMSSCTDSFRENDYPRPWGNSEGDDDDLVPVEFTLSSQRNHDFTRAESSIVSFNSGETIKVFVSTGGGSSYTAYDYTTAAAGQEVGLTAPAPPPYFPDGAASTVQAYAYYPATACASATFSVADNQTSDAAYKSSDLMYAANRTITKGSSEGTKLQMAHKMVQLCITASAASGSDLSIYKVKVNAKKSVTFTPADGTATTTGDNGDVIALTQAGTGYVLIPPQLINNVTVKIETDEVGSAQGTATFGFASTSSFEAGNSYSLDLTVSPTQLGTTTAITDWNGAGSVVIGATGNLTICDLVDKTAYTGTALTPSFTVKKNGVPLVKDDANGYTAQYLNNTNAGTAYVLALGQGTNDGSVGVASFEIEKAAALFSYGESDTENKTYGDAAFTKALTNTGDGTITYTSSVESVATVDAAGQVTIVGAGTTVITASAVDGNNYTYPTNSAHYTLNVAKKAIATADIGLAEESMVYTGSALTRHVASVAGLTDASNWTVTGNTQTNVGNYELTVTMAEACANYTGSATKQWSIGQSASSVSAAPTAKISLTYSGSAQALVNAGTPSGGTMKYKATTANTKPGSTEGFSDQIPTATTVGTYYVWYYVEGDANHSSSAIANTAVSVSIAQKAVTITAKAQTVNYGTAITTGTGQITTDGLASGHSVSAVTLTASTSNVPGGTITPSAATIQDGSSNNVTTNYSITYNTGALTINKVAATKTDPTKKTNLTYTGSAQALANAGSSSHGTYTYCATQGGTYTSTIPTGTNAGTSYTVYWKFTGDTNHNDATGSLTGITIAKATPTKTDPTKKTGLTYNGSAQALANAGSSSHGTYTYCAIQGGTYTSTIPTGTNAGTSYTVYWKFTGSNGNYTDSSGSLTSISIAKYTPTWGSWSNSTASVYVGSTFTRTIPLTGVNNTALTVSYKSSATGTATVNSSGTVTGVAAGSATITAYYTATTNYNAPADQTYTVTISKPLSVSDLATPGDQTYNPLYYVMDLDVNSFGDGFVTATSSGSSVWHANWTTTMNRFKGTGNANSRNGYPGSAYKLSISSTTCLLPTRQMWNSIMTPGNVFAEGSSATYNSPKSGIIWTGPDSDIGKACFYRAQTPALYNSYWSDVVAGATDANKTRYAIRYIGTSYCSVWKYSLEGTRPDAQSTSSNFRLVIQSKVVPTLAGLTTDPSFGSSDQDEKDFLAAVMTACKNGTFDWTGSVSRTFYAFGNTISSSRYSRGQYGHYWTATENESNTSYAWRMFFYGGNARVEGSDKTWSMSVRLFRE